MYVCLLLQITATGIRAIKIVFIRANHTWYNTFYMYIHIYIDAYTHTHTYCSKLYMVHVFVHVDAYMNANHTRGIRIYMYIHIYIHVHTHSHTLW